ncbi:uncharacterized protein LOC123538992 [Mercenaria mercenaria]|uniref:uncharacterized protein LOC123538992 n=1 Tax=Mercenaria mercenaria TaxID=6596 RepID=UPI00234FAC9C|nr:uncharacterized protein LOC123538992 [Mercenaria mercenaria]
MAARIKLSSRTEQRLTTIQPPDRGADSTAKFLAKWPTRCLDHEEVVSRYCLDHDQLLCDVCSMTIHNRCNSVLSLDEASKGIRGGRECTLIEAGIKKLINKYEKMHKEQSNILTNLAEQEKEFIRAVKSFRSDLNAMLDRLENAVMAKKDNYTTRRRDVVREHKQLCKTAMTTLDNYSKDLDRTYLGPDEENLFVALKKSKLVINKYEEQLKTIAAAPKKVFLSFVPNNTIAKFFLSLKDFGEMKADQSAKELVPVAESKPTERRASVASLQSSERSTGDRSERGRTRLSLPNIESSIQEIDSNPKIKTRKPIHVGEVSVHLDTDTETPFVTGCTFMADDNVVLVDEANKNVKFFNPALKPVSVMKLTAPPRDVTPIKIQQIVVTIPTERSLQFIELGKTLILRKKVPLEIECSGITCYNHELYVTSGFSSDREIQIVSLNGEVRKRIRPGIADLRYPLYIVVDPRFRTVFVSDYNHGVVGLDAVTGEVKFKCKDTDVHGYYKGVTVGHKGYIYVCTWNLHGVSRVHLDGRGLETIIPMPGKEGRKPHSTAFSRKSERLIVSLCGGKKGCLSVYRYQ